MEILLSMPEKGNISIYSGTRKYCLYRKKGRIHMSTGKHTYPSLYWKTDTSQFLRAL